MARGAFPLKLGRRIRALRVARGVSQKMVSIRTGLDRSYMSRIENDKLRPSLSTLVGIADVLGVSLGELLEYDGLEQGGRACPISAGGECLVELLDRRPFTTSGSAEHYTPQQLKIIRRYTELVRTADAERLAMLQQLAESIGTGTGRRKI